MSRRMANCPYETHPVRETNRVVCSVQGGTSIGEKQILRQSGTTLSQLHLIQGKRGRLRTRQAQPAGEPSNRRRKNFSCKRCKSKRNQEKQRNQRNKRNGSAVLTQAMLDVTHRCVVASTRALLYNSTRTLPALGSGRGLLPGSMWHRPGLLPHLQRQPITTSHYIQYPRYISHTEIFTPWLIVSHPAQLCTALQAVQRQFNSEERRQDMTGSRHNWRQYACTGPARAARAVTAEREESTAGAEMGSVSNNDFKMHQIHKVLFKSRCSLLFRRWEECQHQVWTLFVNKLVLDSVFTPLSVLYLPLCLFVCFYFLRSVCLLYYPLSQSMVCYGFICFVYLFVCLRCLCHTQN